MSKRKVLRAVNCSLNANGTIVYLDEYETREEAEKALTELVLEYFDFGIEENEE
ncbi:hypothetical protein [Clostridium botulinum]|uniref:hypothetical protein n=1 Tax=Clostridium botulinum TaxID=1491 RepID=UPI00016BB893|nr:hypothetical protein [Clostridium botulinum]EDT84476.1 hypothetical protein CBB_0888 [Clostridium botulinum Bf]MBY6881660.1 hypothetical protein [Clostridium botulinum]WCJ75327.1 hypothetical protein MHB86_003889 [Clostridium botulinum]WCJ79166.1 hypothetical protein MHI66_003889 [Clostridium botulinum]WCJ82989.1 hypothetical protein MHI65_003874 [Clostridium botulinum]